MKKWILVLGLGFFLILASALTQTSEKRVLSSKETIELLSLIDNKTAAEAYLLAQAYVKEGQIDEAMALLDDQIKKTPEDNDLWVLLFDLKKDNQSKDAYYKTLKNYLSDHQSPEAIKRLEAFLPKPPRVSMPSGHYSESFDLIFSRGHEDEVIFINRGEGFEPLKTDRIRLLTDQKLAAYSVNPYGRSETITLTYTIDNLEALLKLAKTSSDEDAIDLYEKILKKHPYNEGVLDLLIGLYEKNKNYSKLIEKLTYGSDNMSDFKYSIALRQLLPETPRVNVKSGTYSVSQLIALQMPNANDTYHYTLDGSLPTKDSPIFENKINAFEGVTTLKLIAISDLNIKSEVATYTYTIVTDESHILFTYENEGSYKVLLKTWEERLTDSTLLTTLNHFPLDGKISPDRQHIAVMSSQELEIYDAHSGNSLYRHDTLPVYDKITFGKSCQELYIESDGSLYELNWETDLLRPLALDMAIKDLTYRNMMLFYTDANEKDVYRHDLGTGFVENFTKDEDAIDKYKPSINLDNHSLIYHTDTYALDGFSNDLIVVDKQYHTGSQKITNSKGHYQVVEWIQNQSFLVNYREGEGGVNEILYMDVYGKSERLLSLRGTDIYVLDYR